MMRLPSSDSSSPAKQPIRLLLASLLLLGMATWYGCDNDQPPPLIPMSVFFMNPDVTSYQISQDGEHVAFLKNWEHRLNLHVQQVGGTDIRRLTDFTQRDLIWFDWANAQKLIYLQDVTGAGNYHLFAVDLQGNPPTDLTPFPGVRVVPLTRSPLLPDHVIITMNRRDPRLLDCYRLDVRTGELELAAENPGNVVMWLADHAGQVRAGLALVDGENQLLYREAETDPFRVAATSSGFNFIEPAGFTFDGNQLYVRASRDRDTEGLYRFDPVRSEFIELLYANDSADLSFLFFSYYKQVLRGVAYVTDRLRWHFFDPEGADIQANLEARLPGYGVWVTSLSSDESRMLVRTFSDKSRGAFYLYDRPRDSLTLLGDASPWINESYLCDMEPVSYWARDGLEIPAYLTLPQGVPSRDLPLVVIPTHSPWQRARWGYDFVVQFLANRGYAVLQINYRGTMGYGRSFMEAGFRELDGAILNDLEDGVHWLVAQGIADSTRVGILGLSLGGYLAQASALSRPDLFQCAATYAAPPNMYTFVNSPPSYWYTSMSLLYELVGHPETDREKLLAMSPVSRVERFDVPLLIAHGINDPITAIAEIDSFVAGLQTHGKNVLYLRVQDEGHDLVRMENRNVVFQTVEEFLGEHLGGRVGARP